jgi:hypothetical protein
VTTPVPEVTGWYRLKSRDPQATEPPRPPPGLGTDVVWPQDVDRQVVRPRRHQPQTVVAPVLVSRPDGRSLLALLAGAVLLALVLGGAAWRSGWFDGSVLTAEPLAIAAPPSPRDEPSSAAAVVEVPPPAPTPVPPPTAATVPTREAAGMPRPSPVVAPPAAHPAPRVGAARGAAAAAIRSVRAAPNSAATRQPPAPAPAIPAPPAGPEPEVAAPAAAAPTAAASAAQSLAPATVEHAVGRHKASFDRCVDAALSAPGGEALAGRKIGLLLAVVSGGLVEAVQVEEPDVERSPLGACLRRIAGRLLFPPFEGEPVGIRVPLQLGATAAPPG